jgi:hypothetical protein
VSLRSALSRIRRFEAPDRTGLNLQVECDNGIPAIAPQILARPLLPGGRCMIVDSGSQISCGHSPVLVIGWESKSGAAWYEKAAPHVSCYDDRFAPAARAPTQAWELWSCYSSFLTGVSAASFFQISAGNAGCEERGGAGSMAITQAGIAQRAVSRQLTLRRMFHGCDGVAWEACVAPVRIAAHEWADLGDFYSLLVWFC